MSEANPKMLTTDFDFDLPPELIAQTPAEPRDSARLMRVHGFERSLHVVRDLPSLLRPGDLLIVNDTKVIPARLFGVREGGGAVEATLTEEVSAGVWLALLKPGRKAKPGDRLGFGEGLDAAVEAKEPDGRGRLRFGLGGAALLEALSRHGSMPLPPYIRRPGGDARDKERYQTVFANEPGAVAAPTAGLHFTPELLSRLDAAGIERAPLTLHVGLGTFAPVKTERLEDHAMHEEAYSVPEATADAYARAKQEGRRVVACGTTVLRALESAAQGEAALRPGPARTSILIQPGHEFRTARLLWTNLHTPRSTLMALVSAFAGYEEIKAAYEQAVRERMRFFSYGDATLLSLRER